MTAPTTAGVPPRPRPEGRLLHALLLAGLLALPALAQPPGPVVGAPQPGPIVDRPGDDERRDPGRPRDAEDPPTPPAGAPPGIHSLKQLNYTMPYYTANPGEASVAFFRKLVESDPKAAEPRGRLAHALVQLGRLAEAEAEGKAALGRDPSDQWALYALALSSAGRFDPEAARGYYERLLATDFSKFRDHFVTSDYIRANLADLLLRHGKTAEAELQVTKAAEGESPTPLALKLVDRFYLRTGRPDLARAVYDRLLAKRPDDLNALVNLGVLHLHAGDATRAVSLLGRAWKRNDRIMKVAYFLHRAHHRAGDAKAAAEWLVRCAAFDPREQAELDFRADLVSPYPCSDIIRQCAAAAAGDRRAFHESQESLLERDEEDAMQGAMLEEGFLDRLLEGEGFPEFKEEEAFRYYFETHPGRTGENRFVERLRATMAPSTPALRARAESISALLREERFAEALAVAEEGLARDPECLGFLAQAGVAAQSLGRTDKALALFRRATRMRLAGGGVDGGDVYLDLLEGGATAATLAERDETAYLARLFAALCAVDRFVMKRVEGPEGPRYLRTEATVSLSDADLDALGRAVDAARRDLAAVSGRSDSRTAHAFARLIASNLAAMQFDGRAASRAFRDCLKGDPDLALPYALYYDYGKYFGY